MPRGRKPLTEESMELQIEKAQEKVIKTKNTYEKAVEELQRLLDKRDAKRKDELWKAVISSDKSYDEILKLITNTAVEE